MDANESLYWEGFVEAAQTLGVQAPTLSGFAMRQELNRQFGFRSSPVIVFAAGAFTILPPGRIGRAFGWQIYC